MCKATGLVSVLVSAMLLASCASTGTGGFTRANQAPAEATDTPVEGGVNVQSGSEEDFIVNVGRRTFFAEGSAALDDTARMTLDKQAMWLSDHPQWKVKLQGFADDPGSAAQQTALSQKRADAVRDYLVSKGIAKERMRAKGYGRDRLVGDCADIECKAQNRRVITNPQEVADF
jgi:peptidoglycan-associated lipoprotein